MPPLCQGASTRCCNTSSATVLTTIASTVVPPAWFGYPSAERQASEIVYYGLEVGL
ncbi:hypothetical protein CERSUDRAFT_101583 [Gelatoporia subvermispora B]|uniref:Uncharacterized protein n=1 Tax=Ceriporiopsis subvermispora (strain B) TaxID=914234 RepID=M2QWF9_CERS8|nr:hypothetical protein CERSUDRAFT_101583 [Gelatoporia subvermispora B]